MSVHRPFLLVALAALFAVSSTWFGLTVLATEGPAFSFPDERVLVEPVLLPESSPEEVGASPPGVTIRLRPKARVLPPRASPPCRLLRGTQEVSGKVAWVAGSAALPVGPHRKRGRQLVRVSLPTGEEFHAVVTLSPGEEEMPTVVLGGPFSYRSRVVDRDGHAIADARVWLAGRESKSDGDGRFLVENLPIRSGLPMVIRAQGKATIFRILDLADAHLRGDLPAHALEDGVSLHVQLAAPISGDAPLGRVYLMPADQGGDSRLRHYPFFLAEHGGGISLSSEGTCKIEGLPRGVEVRVVAHHPRLRIESSVVVELGDDVNYAMVKGAEAPLLSGRVVDLAGQPAPGASVVSSADRDGEFIAHGQLLGWVLPPAVFLSDCDWAMADGDGRFLLARSETNSYVTVVAPGCHGIQQKIMGRAQNLDRQFVLPHVAQGVESGDGPALDVRVGRPVRMRIWQRAQSLTTWFPWTPDRPYHLDLKEPVLMDVDIEIDGRDEVITVKDVAVVGRVPLQVPN